MTESGRRESETQRDIKPEIEDEYYDEPYSTLQGNRFSDFNFKSSGKSISSLVLAGFGVCALVVILVTFFFGSGDSGESSYNAELEAHIGQLENKIADLETLSARLAALETGSEQIVLLTSRVSGFETSVTTRLDNLDRKIALAERRLSNLSRKPSAVARPETKQVSKKSVQRTATYHVVQKGDTLYRLSKMYGLSVNQLRKANKLTPSSKIYPGQKLRVSL